MRIAAVSEMNQDQTEVTPNYVNPVDWMEAENVETEFHGMRRKKAGKRKKEKIYFIKHSLSYTQPPSLQNMYRNYCTELHDLKFPSFVTLEQILLH